ncbi:hypothetical protein SCHPADRAFT_996405 [Schizopora paradoxa]|uniref:F-box domain-containing protein n=1 Tax=Schizopora paradoxa TaxID=27342 RepID=A0A0H2RRM7_9AGAM|nr:hypothetical protein SCHPADRAFT_996405 [Schizopora paradoxa]
MDLKDVSTMENVCMAKEMLSQMKDSARLQETNNLVSDPEVNRDIDAPTFNNANSEAVLKAKTLCTQRLSAFEDLTQAMQAARNTIQGVVRALEASSYHVQGAIKDVEEEKLRVIRARGLAKLSDDVLELIFLAAMNDDNTSKMAFHLSSVCRRFRSIVLSTPRMWSRILSTSSEHEIDVCLKYSGSAGLHLNLQRTFIDMEVRPVARDHRKRWESVSIWVDRDCCPICDPFADAGLDALPRLRSVILQNTQYCAIGAPTLNKLVQSLRTSARNVCYLKLYVSSPFRLSLPSSLTCLELGMCSPRTSTPGSMQDFIAMLRSAPLLEDVKLDMSNLERFECYTPPRPEERFATFPCVEKLALSFSAEYEMISVPDTLYFPNVKDLTLTVIEKDMDTDSDYNRYYEDDYGGPSEPEIDDIDPGLDLAYALFQESKEYPNLTSLSLRFYFANEYKRKPTCFLEEGLIVHFAERCPLLQHLFLDCTMPINYLRLPSLNHITLFDCTLKSVGWLLDYAEGSKEDETWSSFGILQVLGCKFADKDGSWDDLISSYGSKLELFPISARRHAWF